MHQEQQEDGLQDDNKTEFRQKSNCKDMQIAECGGTEAEQINIRNYMLKSLKEEINNWKNLEHENIVRFLDFTETSNNLYFFLEYCDSE